MIISIKYHYYVIQYTYMQLQNYFSLDMKNLRLFLNIHHQLAFEMYSGETCIHYIRVKNSIKTLKVFPILSLWDFDMSSL